MRQEVTLRPFVEQDREQLERWRSGYPRELDMPHDYEGQATETCIAEIDGRMILGLTATVCVSLDPLLRNPSASNFEVSEALKLAEGVLRYKGVESGAVDAYIAIPVELVEYIELLKKRGYEVTASECVIMRKVILPEPKVNPEGEPIAELANAATP